jgi:hypothetical protein
MSDDHTNLDDDNIVTAAAARGTILLTLRNVVPYTSWYVKQLFTDVCSRCMYTVTECLVFMSGTYLD